MRNIAIIPARSGSKSFVNKNIHDFMGKPLFTSSIRFAQKLKYIDEIIVLTDSHEYAEIAIKHGAKVPYIRDKSTSGDLAMEEDILYEFWTRTLEPSIITWLRPTHPLREISVFDRAFDLFKSGDMTSVCVVTECESRLYKSDSKGRLIPIQKSMTGKSMWRRQDMLPAYKLYHGEIFELPQFYNKDFLGDKIGFVEQSKLCAFDIDDESDLDYLLFKINDPNYASLLH